MASPAEQLWSGKTRGFFEFEPIAPTNRLQPGAVGVAVGSRGRAAFFSYLKQPKVIFARLEAEGFEQAGPGATAHPWYLRLEPGVVEPGEKALCRALTSEHSVRGSRSAASRRSNVGGGFATPAGGGLKPHAVWHPLAKACTRCSDPLS